ncbi:hypothetical protein EGW08_015633, partial [Elysia chlorotica]
CWKHFIVVCVVEISVKNYVKLIKCYWIDIFIETNTMAKRGAASELNHDNWDEEEEPEEAGIFVQADKETLQHRVIKKAKRRGAGSEDVIHLSYLTPFIAFAGSKSTALSGGSTGLFSGASSSKAQPLNGSNERTTGGGSGKPGAWPNKGQGDWKDSPEYFKFLKDLNLSVLAWIKQHVEENPYIILTPIFKDYEHYLQEKGSRAAATTDLSTPTKKDSLPSEDDGKTASVKSSETQGKPFSFQAESTKELSASDKGDTDKSLPTYRTENGSETQKGFSFNTNPLSGSGGTKSKSGFSFGANATTTASTTSSGFSFGTTSSGLGKPFSFGTSASTPATSGFSFGVSAIKTGASSAGTSQDTNGKNEDEDYVPPKPEVREIKEDDALYSKRCKLYFQRDERWVDKGVGNLHLKPVGESKTQLLVRADTNLGNILLNVMLSASTPVSRQGKNNVLVVCVPNPPLDVKAKEDDQNKPVPMLIRVKAESDADELFQKIDERKKML